MQEGAHKFRLFARNRLRTAEHLRLPVSSADTRRELRLSLDVLDETLWQRATPLGKWCIAAVTVGLMLLALLVLLNLDVG
jgi:hypothetical protein